MRNMFLISLPSFRQLLLTGLLTVTALNVACGPRLKRVAALPGNPVIIEKVKCDEEPIGDLVRGCVAQHLSNSISSGVFTNDTIPESYTNSLPSTSPRHKISIRSSLVMGDKVINQGGESQTRGRARTRSRTTGTEIHSGMVMGFVVSVHKDGVLVESSTFYQKYSKRARYYDPAQAGKIIADRVHRILIKNQLVTPKWQYIPYGSEPSETTSP